MISRRTVLAGALCSSAFPVWAQSNPTNPDVVIVGAGAAGIAAALGLLKKGKSVIVIEAADRAGGRAYTESRTFGVPFDHGCSWISAADSNPYMKLARNAGFELLDHSAPGEALFVGDRRANAKERRKYDRAWESIQGALGRAGEKGLDVAASSVIQADMDFSGVCQSWIGPMDYGVDFDDLSTMDNWISEGGNPNFMVREGHGTLVAREAVNLPIRLNTSATRVNWGGSGVSVETPSGTISAKACIVTVSTGVLGAGSIRFSPELPDWKHDAIHNLPMGLLTKIGLQFDGKRFGLKPNEWLTYWVDNNMPAEACYFLTWPFDFELMIGFVGGTFGWELSRAGADAAVDFALGEVVRMVGSDARKHFVKGYMTDWAADPNVLGAYAAPRPGHYSARALLAEPLADRLFFAGEAVAGPYVALCGGAHLSGSQVADRVAAVVD